MKENRTIYSYLKKSAITLYTTLILYHHFKKKPIPIFKQLYTLFEKVNLFYKNHNLNWYLQLRLSSLYIFFKIDCSID